MRKAVGFFVVGVLIVALGAAGYRYFLSDSAVRSEAEAMVLLVSPDIDFGDPRVTIWLDAAREEGLHLRAMRSSDFLRPYTNRRAIPGVILPDGVLREAPGMFSPTLENYVEAGGNLLVVYDAATVPYRPEGSRLSKLVGVDYALFGRRGAGAIVNGSVQGTKETLAALLVPPGKYVAVDEAGPAGSRDYLPADRKKYVISGYSQQKMEYPGFISEGDYDGEVLLASPEKGLVAGARRHGAGNVLFANLPLGYLKDRTDGLFLHGFLRYFADKVLGLAYLSPAPDGVGGIQMNWHMDSNAAIQPIIDIDKTGIYEQGPYSIHITAGPDARAFGDGLGINVPNNPVIQKWIRDMIAKGHAIGPHGGWIHDYFGLNVSDDNRAQFEKFLVLNKKALEDVMGKPALEYSAPVGNQPQWVTGWLEANGFLAYYFTGNSGLGPTRSYRDGRLKNRHIWSFPVMTYRDLASFEEFAESELGSQEVGDWLRAVTDFSADRRVVRLVYFHPPGVTLYMNAMRAWLGRAKELAGQGRFRWYTMTDMARFLNDREQVQWHIEGQAEGEQQFFATHPVNLARQTWLLPKQSYSRPEPRAGKLAVREAADYWAVTAAEGTDIAFSARRTRR
ncbi:MAG: hypothetical protein A2150_04675 [Candidatus Muproteobacteria bacterium RBG_16_64_11]|uniref:Uncharacterized protein n=1 Tax=Candidatus Muproteobacteria bacterium RBG_16_64_11 TaxID=1817758 RepID=A0A1F6TB87_9PROT|nr:MAG: hypothetical protein A2150_04675 [Candidatus Muproteobacteria bacterium RBG_16_64_11]